MSDKRHLPDIAFRRPLLCVGTTGAGKSYNMCEQRVIPTLERGEQVVIVDPTDAWFGLQFRPDGKKASPYDVAIFGGEHGNMPLTPNMGKALGELLGRERINAILSLAELEVSEQIHFMADFAATLFRVNRKPLHLVIDEADEFCPSQPQEKGELPKCMNRVKRIVARGRRLGFRPVLITQRPQGLSTSVRNLCQVMVALNVTGTHDLRAIYDYVKTVGDAEAMKGMLESLAGLEVGEAWVWGPRDKVLEKVSFGKLSVYDSFKEDEGIGAVGTVPLGKANLTAINEALAEFERVRKENDPALLRDRIRELEGEIAEAAGPSQEDLDQYRAEGVDEGQRLAREEIEPIIAELEEKVTAADRAGRERGYVEGYLRGWGEGWTAAFENAGERLLQSARTSNPPTPRAPEVPEDQAPALQVARPQRIVEPVPPAKLVAEARQQAAAAVARRKPGPMNPPVTHGVQDGLTVPQQRVLDAVHWWNRAGVPEPTRIQVAVAARYTPGTGNVKNIFGALVGMGLLEQGTNAGTVKLTAAGTAKVGNTAPAKITRMALVECIVSLLDVPEHKVWGVIYTAGRDISRAEAATGAGYAPGTGNVKNILGSLSGKYLIEKAGNGVVRVPKWIMGVRGF